MAFTRLGSAEGLSQGAVRGIIQDAQGFMWFGTEDGLDRYDGYELRHFIHNRGDSGSLANNWLTSLAIDSAGRLWVGSDGGGVAWRDTAAGIFQHVDPQTGQPLIDPLAKVRTLHLDRSGRLWITTRSEGVRSIDLQRHVATDYRHRPEAQDSLGDDVVFAVEEDAAGDIWFGTASGLDRLDMRTGRFEHFTDRLRAAGAPRELAVRVNALCADGRGSLWIGLESGGLARMDVATGAITLLRHRDDDPNTLPDARITALLEDREQRLWVGTSAGLALLDRRTEHFSVVRHDPTAQDSLPDSNIVSLYEDRNGLLWIGTKAGGVARWNPRSWSFGHHRFGDELADNVTSFAVDRRGTIWVGSFGAGAAAMDPQTGVTRRYRRGRDSALALRDDTVMAILTDERDRVWLGTMNHGVERIDAARRTITHFDFSPNDAASLPAAGVMSLLRDSRGRIWVGTYGGGLAMIDPASDRIARYPHGRNDTGSLFGDRATALAEDRTGLIWIGTDGGGLNVLDPATDRFVHFVHDPRNAASLSADIVYAVHMDDKGTLWVGTRGGGLDRVTGAPFSKEGLQFANLSEPEGLPDSTVYGIESDATGRLWISTNRGLANVQRDSRSVRAFRRDHGLQADEFNFGAHYRAPDGALYFGGSNGYNAFVPERLQLDETPPTVVLTDVLKLNSRVSAAPESLRQLDLGFRDAVVTFQFAALDFTGPSHNRYRYRLDGFDPDWVDAGTARQATYTHLDGGTYVFRVRAANNDGRWSETPLEVTLHVAPPPWSTWWARTLYGIALFAILFGLWRGHKRRRQREVAYARRLEKEVDERTAELAERNREMEQINRQLREVSLSDSLTGLGNRRFLHEAMSVLTRETGTIPSPCVLMVIDVDFLKPINDQYGHEGGDAVLIQVAEILRREFRSDDLIARWGGDEFVVLCRNCDMVTASILAERVRSSVAKRIFRVGDGLAARTSCSIGFASLPFIPNQAQPPDWERCLSIADLALYEAKRDRNSWIGWSGTEKAATLLSVFADLSASPAALELDGYIIVSRRPWNPEETVDLLRAPRFPAST